MVFVSLGAALLLVGCGRREPAATSGTSGTANSAASSQILRLSQRNEPADLDPALVTLPDEFALLRALSEGLLIPNGSGGTEPGAAARYDVSADGLTYRFHLRPDARWSNGEPVTAADFVASYRRALTPATAAPKANVFFAVKNAREFLAGRITDFAAVGFRAADARTLVVTLAQPLPAFPHYVASGPWIPVHPATVAKHGRQWTRPGNFVGNGPFTLAEWRPHQRIVVKKNPAWHGAAGVRLAEIHFIHFDNGDAEERAYRAGQIDATMSVPFAKVEVYARDRPAELHRAAMNETRYLSFNTRRAPLTDERVRLALALAIDRARLVERVLRGGQPVAPRLVPPGLRLEGGARSPSGRGLEPKRETDAGTQAGSESRPHLESEHTHAPERARELLAAAGFAGGKNFPRLEITAWSSSQSPTVEALQAMWRQELGVEVGIALREAKVHLAALAAGDYDIGFITAIPDVADAGQLLGDFATGAPENYPQWSERAFDAALADARALNDAAGRAQKLLAAEDVLLRRAPLTPLYFNLKIWLMSPRVRGWQEDGLWTRCYHTVYLDEK